MNKTTEALKLAEEALEELHYSSGTVKAVTLYKRAIAVIHEALAEQMQEPIGFEEALEALYWEFDARVKGYGKWKLNRQSERDAFKKSVRSICAAPVERQWVDLTDDEIEELLFNRVHNDPLNDYARRVIAKFKAKQVGCVTK